MKINIDLVIQDINDLSKKMIDEGVRPSFNEHSKRSGINKETLRRLMNDKKFPSHLKIVNLLCDYTKRDYREYIVND